jgi:hypothetical protein
MKGRRYVEGILMNNNTVISPLGAKNSRVLEFFLVINQRRIILNIKIIEKIIKVMKIV